MRLKKEDTLEKGGKKKGGKSVKLIKVWTES